MTENLAALHANAIWKLAWKLSTPKDGGGGGLPAIAACAKAVAEVERLAPDHPEWVRALAGWRAWRP
jgi:hypothetical protein